MKNTTIKKILSLITLTLLATIVLAGCGKSSDQSVKKIQSKKTLVVGTSADYPPFEFTIVKNGKKQVVGYDIMIAKQIAKDLGVKLKIVNTEFPSLISELQDKKVDIVMAGMVSTKQRKKAVAFSKSYYTVKNVLLVKKADANKYSSAASLKGKSIGAQQSTTQETIAKKQLASANLVIEANFTSLTSELKNGTLAGVVTEKEIADNLVKTYPNTYAEASVKLTTPANDAQINVAMRKGDTALQKQVNKTITKLKKSGKLAEYFKKAQKLQQEYK